MAAVRETKHQQGEKRATEEKPEKQELVKTTKKQHTWQLSLNVDMLSLLTYAHKNLGNSYTLLTNSGTPPSLPPTRSANKSRALPSASFSWTVKAMLIFWNNRRAPFCRLRGGLSRFLYAETYLISIPVAPKLMAMDRLPTNTAMATSLSPYVIQFSKSFFPQTYSSTSRTSSVKMDSKTGVRLLLCVGIFLSTTLPRTTSRPISQPTGAVGSCNTQPESQSIRHLHALNTVWWTLRSKAPKRFHGMIEGHHRYYLRVAKTKIPVLPWNQAATGP
jgi:hypothetical protein